MNERWRFRAWVLAGVLVPIVGVAVSAACASTVECLASALTWFGTVCELAGLAFAAMQLDSVARRWGFEGFWSYFRLAKKAAALPITSGDLRVTEGDDQLDGRAEVGSKSPEDRIRALEERHTHLERGLSGLARKLEAEADERRAAIQQAEYKARYGVEELRREVGEEAVADFGTGFFAILLTGAGMLVTNLANPLSQVLPLRCPWRVWFG